MVKVLDLTDLTTKRYFIVGNMEGYYDALMRLLYQQKFSWADTLICTGNFLNLEHPRSFEMVKFLRNTMNSYSVRGQYEITFLKYLEDPEKNEELKTKLGTNYHPAIIDYIKELPLVIKMGDFYVMYAGLDPTKTLDDQDEDVFYSIEEYDKDSRFYQYPNPESSSWYNVPFLIDGKHVKICFSRLFLKEYQVPSGYNLGCNKEAGPMFRCLIVTKSQGFSELIEWQ